MGDKLNTTDLKKLHINRQALIILAPLARLERAAHGLGIGAIG